MSGETTTHWPDDEVFSIMRWVRDFAYEPPFTATVFDEAYNSEETESITASSTPDPNGDECSRLAVVNC